MPLTFGDTHPSAGPVDTADMLFSMDEVETELHPRVANSSLEAMVFAVGEERLLRGEQNIKKQMLWMREYIYGLAALRDRLQADTRRLQADNSSLQADKTGLEAENRRLDTENRSLKDQLRRANDAWETKHVFGFALSEPIAVPPAEHHVQSPRPGSTTQRSSSTR